MLISKHSSKSKAELSCAELVLDAWQEVERVFRAASEAAAAQREVTALRQELAAAQREAAAARQQLEAVQTQNEALKANALKALRGGKQAGISAISLRPFALRSPQHVELESAHAELCRLAPRSLHQALGAD